MGAASRDGKLHGVPPRRDRFIGRTKEISAVSDALGHARVVSVIGPGGAGKTRLVAELAGRVLGIYDHVWFVNLAPVTDDRLVPDAVRATLRTPLSPGTDVEDAVATYLEPLKALLILDNCEHLAAGARLLVGRLIDAASELTVLATSRSPLELPGEFVHRLSGLPVGAGSGYDAETLFVERARSVSPGFSLEGDAQAVTALCHRLDGSPLAIELAAARLGTLSAREILDRLGQRLDLLSRSEGVGPVRHQSVHAAVDWSYELLGAAEQTVFRRASYFAGSFSLNAAERVCSGSPIRTEEVLHAVGGLLTKSLLAADRHGSLTRYRMNEVTRAYARERLRDSGEEPTAAAAHRAWSADVARNAAMHLRGPALLEWLDALDEDIDDLRLAMQTGVRDGDPSTATEIATALLEYWMVRGNWKEGQRWLDLGLEAGGQIASALRRDALNASAVLADLVSDYRLAERRLMEMLTLARADDDRHSEGVGLFLLAHTHERRGDVAIARPLLEQSIPLLRESDDIQSLRRALVAQANLTDSLPAARRLLEESVELARVEGDPQTIAGYLLNLGETCQRLGAITAARSAFTEALTVAEGLHYDRYIARAVMCLGEVELAEGNLHGARSLLERAAELWPEIGHLNAVAESTFNLGELARAEGDTAAADSLVRQALASYQRLEMRRHEGVARQSLAAIRRSVGDFNAARELAHRALEIAVALPDRPGIVHGLERLGGVLIDDGAIAEAARLFGAAAGMRDQIGQQPTVLEVTALEADASVGRAAVGAAWDAGIESGRALRLDDVLLSLGVGAPAGNAMSTQAPAGPLRALFRADGSHVTVAFGGPPFSVQATKGTGYIAELLRRPGQEIHVRDLAGLRGNDGSPGPLIDEEAKEQYRRRLEDLREESAEAEAFNDPERAARAESEIEALARELSRAVGLGGRSRTAGTSAERARLNVSRAIRSAIRRIETHDARLAHHLNSCIRTGSYCSYIPDPVTVVTWSLGAD